MDLLGGVLMFYDLSFACMLIGPVGMIVNV